MPSRRLVLAALVAFLAPAPAAPTAAAEPAPQPTATDGAARGRPAARTRRPTRTTKKRATRTRSKRATRTKATRAGSRRARGPRQRRTAAERAFTPVAAKDTTPANMPDGWSWPPAPAMIAAGEACTARLDELGVEWEAAAAAEKIATPITVPSLVFGELELSSTYRKPPFVMDCHLALALATAAADLQALGVRQLRFSRIHDYTLVRTQGRTRNALSRHALGLAIDLRAVVDADGREAQVVRDYKAGDPLLLAVEDYLNGAGTFRTVLSPKNDPASHHDHFHLEVKVAY